MNNDTPPPVDPLANLCHALDLSRFGEGNRVAGANVLVAMCASLVSLEGLEEGLEDPEAKRRLTTGLSLLSSDPVTTRLLVQHVFRPLRELQRIHLVNAAGIMKARKDLERIAMAKCVVPSARLEAAKRLHETPIHRSVYQSESYELVDLFKEDEDDRRDRAFTRPRFLASSVGTSALARELKAAHDGRILATLEFSRIEQVAPLDDLLNALLAGSHLPETGDYAAAVSGHVIATVPDFMGQWIANPNGCTATWPNRVFWLAPKWPSSLKVDRLPRSGTEIDLPTAFRKAAKELLNKRLQGMPGSMGKAKGFEPAYLRARKEIGNLPGMPSRYGELCMTLFATLWRGLQMLTKAAGEWPAGITAGIHDFVLTLVQGSLSHLNDLQGHALVRSRRKLAQQIYDKLPEPGESRTPRDFVRKGIKTSTAEVTIILTHLEGLGLATRQDNSWGRTDTPAPAARKLIETSNPTIEIDVTPA